MKQLLLVLCLPLLFLLFGCQAEGGDASDVTVRFPGPTVFDPHYPQSDVGGDGDAYPPRDDKEPQIPKRYTPQEEQRAPEKEPPTRQAPEDEGEASESVEPRPARPWEAEGQEEIADDGEGTVLQPCPEIYDVPDVNRKVKDIVCDFITWASASYIHHSGKRMRLGTSRHNSGDALDFRIQSYEGMDRHTKLSLWNVDLNLFIHYFMTHKAYEPLGLGVYCDSPNPFFHVDTRDEHADWSRIRGRYRPFSECLTWIHNQLK